VRSIVVVIGDELGYHGAQMPFAEDDDVIEALAA
jgi:hypothetical protein